MFMLTSFLILWGECHEFQLTDVGKMFNVTVNLSLTDTEIQMCVSSVAVLTRETFDLGSIFFECSAFMTINLCSEHI